MHVGMPGEYTDLRKLRPLLFTLRPLSLDRTTMRLCIVVLYMLRMYIYMGASHRSTHTHIAQMADIESPFNKSTLEINSAFWQSGRNQLCILNLYVQSGSQHGSVYFVGHDRATRRRQFRLCQGRIIQDVEGPRISLGGR